MGPGEVLEKQGLKSELDRALDATSEEIQMLLKVVTMLEVKLSPILHSIPDGEAMDPANRTPDGGMNTMFAQLMMGQVFNIQATRLRLESIVDRLEAPSDHGLLKTLSQGKR